MEEAIAQYFGTDEGHSVPHRNPLDSETLDNTYLLRKTKVSKYKAKKLHPEN